MAVERRNPLPKGSYWIDIPPEDQKAFDAWRRNASVKTRATQRNSDDGWTWYRFDVTAPVAWGGWGFPTISDPNVDDERDVKQLPPPEPDWTDRLEGAISSAGTKTFVTIGVVALGVYAINKLLR